MSHPYSVSARRAGWAVVAITLLICSACGYIGGPKTIEEKVEDLQSEGVELDKQRIAGRDAWAVDLSGMTISDDLLWHVKGLGKVYELNLSHSTFGDEHVDAFQDLGLGTVAMKLDFSHTELTDEGLDKLKNLRALTEINLSGTKVTPEGIARLKERQKNWPVLLPAAKNPKVVQD